MLHLRVSCAALVLASACAGTPSRPTATEVVVEATASSAGPASCRDRPLVFAPAADTLYRFSAEERHTSDAEGTHRKLYESSIVFHRDPEGRGWTALEDRFAEPFSPWTYGDLAGTELRWRLDGAGVPSSAPEQWPAAKRPGDLLTSLSFFVFQPVGVVLRSTCPGDEGTSSWDQGDRRRAYRFRVMEAIAESVSLHVESAVQTPRNAWRIEGELHVSLADGLTGEARLHVTGPGAPAFNDDLCIVRIRRQPVRERE